MNQMIELKVRQNNPKMEVPQIANIRQSESLNLLPANLFSLESGRSLTVVPSYDVISYAQPLSVAFLKGLH